MYKKLICIRWTGPQACSSETGNLNILIGDKEVKDIG